MLILDLHKTEYLENCTVDVFSTPLTEPGASLGVAVLIAVISKKYDFEYLKINKEIKDKAENDPIVFSEKNDIILKDICEKVTDQFLGIYGNCYLQILDKEEKTEIGLLFLNDGTGKLGAVYNCKDEAIIEKTRKFLDKSCTFFFDNKDMILRKISLPKIQEENNQ